MVNAVRRIVIWAHSECRSTVALYLAVQALARARGIDVQFCLWGKVEMPDGRRMPLDGALQIGDDLERGRAALRQWGGADSVQVFCLYQNSSVWRRLIVEAKHGGARVVVYSEPPCEMCLGLKAVLKRCYYRWVLPWRVRKAVRAADLFISQGGAFAIDRLIRLGWDERKIVPFGYASPRIASDVSENAFATAADERRTAARGAVGKLRVLHLGSESPYRGVGVLERAEKVLDRDHYELIRTGGVLSPAELVARIRSADVVVACGLCEPWGMRVNDVLLEGTPVIVSEGMGAAVVCKWYGCGLVVAPGRESELVAALRRCREDPALLSRLREGARTAATALLPENRAPEWLAAVLGEGTFGRRRRTCIHVCDGWEKCNGAANVARMIASEQTAAGAMVSCRRWTGWRELRNVDEVWIHCGWKPCLWWTAFSCALIRVMRRLMSSSRRTTLSWMPAACYDPIRLRYHGWKKFLVGPIERGALRRCDRIVATCPAEADWVAAYLGTRRPAIVVTDIKRFFRIRAQQSKPAEASGSRQLPLRILYLGRRHPLKGVDFLETAVDHLNAACAERPFELRLVSTVFGAELERVWEWCDVLCLPTVSDNLGLVIAEALERGKTVVTTDGAPAWIADCTDVVNERLRTGYGGRLVCLMGFREGTDEARVALLKMGLRRLLR